MGIFQQFPYTNFHEMNLDYLLRKIKELGEDIENWESKITEYLSNHPEWCTPELYGAKGDGETDDTEAIQKAITYHRCIFFSPKTYKCTATINVPGDRTLEGYNTNIVSDASPAFKFQSYTGSQDHSQKPILFHGFNIYGNNNNELVRVEKALKLTIEEINFYNFHIGMHVVSGYELVANTLRMVGSSYGTTGILIESGDSAYKNIIMRDVCTGLDVRTGRNLFDNVHCWILNSDYFQNSIMIKSSTVGGGDNIYNNMYFDTYHYCFWKTGAGKDIINTPTVILLKSVADGAGVNSGEFIHYENLTTTEATGRVEVYNYIAQILNPTFYALSNKPEVAFKFSASEVSSATAQAFNAFNGSATFTLAEHASIDKGAIKFTPDALLVNIVLDVDPAHAGHYDDALITFNQSIYFPVTRFYCNQFDNGTNHYSDVEVDFIANGIRVRGSGKILINAAVPYWFLL